MNFALTGDQVALRDGIRSLLDGKLAIGRVRDGFDRGVHDELAGAGVFSLASDGFTTADASVVFEELGRALVPGPLVWSALADGLLDPVTSVIGGVEIAPDVGAIVVEHLDALDALLVLDRGRGELRRLDPRAVVGRAAAWPLDPLTPATFVETLPDGDALDADVGALARRGAVLTSAYQVGMAAALTDLATAYAKQREQFGRPIGEFQAVKHLCADMAVRVEVARVAVHAAACMLDDPAVGDVERAVSGAKLLAGEAAVRNGRAATQVHGGMGYTWEVDVHLYLKRAWLLDTTFGSPDVHADAIAATLPGRT